MGDETRSHKGSSKDSKVESFDDTIGFLGLAGSFSECVV